MEKSGFLIQFTGSKMIPIFFIFDIGYLFEMICFGSFRFIYLEYNLDVLKLKYNHDFGIELFKKVLIF